jgi:hypothetical protein
MTIYDWLASLWRTAVPLIVGVAAVQLTRLGVEIDEATVASALTAGFGTVYYAVVRLAEQHLGRGWGWLLGLARPPHYDRPDGELRALSRGGR